MSQNNEQLEITESLSLQTLSPLRSENVQEIITQKPPFIERKALILFLFILLLIIGGTWFIKYPDLIQASGVLTAENAPKEIVIRQEGKLIKLFAANDINVKQGAILGWIESTGNHKEVLILDSLLNKAIALLANNRSENVSVLFNNKLLDLGEIQSSYQQFITAWQQFNDYLTTGYYYKKKQDLFTDLSYLKDLHKTLDEQKQLSQQDLQLTQEGFDANNYLYNDKVISKQDLRDQKSKLVGKQINLPQIDASLLNNLTQQLSKQKEIEELEHTISLQKTIFQQALQTMKSNADEWIKKYIITAPITGKVVFTIPIQENRFMQQNTTIGYINPNDAVYYVQTNLQQTNFGKLDTGQQVQLRFDAYPYQEFGYVKGMLNYISKVPSDSGFLSTIRLREGLATNMKKEIQYKNNLKCQVFIITKQTRLLQRFFYNFTKGIER